MVAVSEGKYRLVHRAAAGRSELYDHAADPREQVDVGAEEPEVLERLAMQAQEYLERPPAPWKAEPSVELQEQELDQLRALGYSVQ
jgi:hypothetical protein